MVWQYQLPAARLTSAWLRFMDLSGDLSNPDNTYRLEGVRLRLTRHRRPEPGILLDRIMVSSPSNARL